jgi:hypothetical protein
MVNQETEAPGNHVLWMMVYVSEFISLYHQVVPDFHTIN